MADFAFHHSKRFSHITAGVTSLNDKRPDGQGDIGAVVKFCVTGASTISKPGTAPTTATAHAGFLRDAAYGACRTGSLRGCYTRAALVGDIRRTLL